MSPVFFVIPGDLSLPTGGYGYDRQVLEHAHSAGLDLRHLPIPGGYPFPGPGVLAETTRLIAETPSNAALLIDGLAYGAMPAQMIRGFNRPIVELCHHPLALEPGLAPDAAARFHASERAAMALARHIIVTGPATKSIVARDFGVAQERITVTLPGTERAARAKGSSGGPLRLLAVGSIIPRKAYDVMVAGLATLVDLDWRLDIVGATQHAPETVDDLRKQIAESRLEDRIAIMGPLTAEALETAYQSADIFVMTSLYEGYGMVIAEAMARGLPIVAAAGGAVADTLPDAAGLKVPPGDSAAFAAAVREVIADSPLRRRYAEGAWRAGQQLPTWADAARIIANVMTKAIP